jgi:uncharacterized protein YecE (DUF72 family)
MGKWIGTSGWSYDHWQGIVYPPSTPVSKRLEYYVRRFDTVEANNTFYHWPRDITFTHWNERLPAGFVFTLKASRVLTHILKLTRPEKSIERMRPGLTALGDKLGVLLIQLPPSLGIDLPRLEHLLELLPKEWKTAIEFRHATWHVEPTFELLERYRVAYCVMSGANLPCILRATAPFVYVRLHGPDPNHLYGGSYSDDDMRWWADRLREWEASGHDVYAYFNNDWEGNAVRNAEALRHFSS